MHSQGARAGGRNVFGASRQDRRKRVSKQMLDSLSLDQAETLNTVSNHEAQADRQHGPSVIHEGHSIIIDIPTSAKRESFMLPLRNGFPIHAADRHAPVFALYNHFHEVVGLVVKIPGFGLSVHFHTAIPGGRFYFAISGPVGTA